MDSLSEAFRYTDTETETRNGDGDETDTETKTEKKTLRLPKLRFGRFAPKKGALEKKAYTNRFAAVTNVKQVLRSDRQFIKHPS